MFPTGLKRIHSCLLHFSYSNEDKMKRTTEGPTGINVYAQADPVLLLDSMVNPETHAAFELGVL